MELGPGIMGSIFDGKLLCVLLCVCMCVCMCVCVFVYVCVCVVYVCVCMYVWCNEQGSRYQWSWDMV